MPLPQMDGLLLQALNNRDDPEKRDARFIVSVERQCRRHLFALNDKNDQTTGLVGSLDLPRLNSYHRMLVHRVARYYGLQHYVHPESKCLSLYKPHPDAPCPPLHLETMIEPESPAGLKEEAPKREPIKKFRILKRPSHVESGPITGDTKKASDGDAKKLFLKREDEYARIRERLFEGIDEDECDDFDSDRPVVMPTTNVMEPVPLSYTAVPYYPAYYLAEQQVQQTPASLKKEAPIPETDSNVAQGEQPSEPFKRATYSMDVSDIRIPRHILQAPGGGNSPAGPKNVVRFPDSDMVLIVFGSVDDAERFLASQAGKACKAEPWQPAFLPFDMLSTSPSPSNSAGHAKAIGNGSSCSKKSGPSNKYTNEA
jgi:hypothetical protein